MSNFLEGLSAVDKDVFDIILKEKNRQKHTIELIASENIVTKAVLEAQGSVLTNKYAEGYPGKRYYGGCEVVDEVENLAIERVKKLFNCEYANVQPHSGSQANMAVYLGLLTPGDKIMGMDLSAGGHLTHGAKVSFSGKIFEPCFYSVDKETSLIDYNEVEKIAILNKPKLIIAGGSSYSRIIDFKKFRAIADKVGAILMVDMAHFAGLVAGGVHPSPFPHAHVVTSTTHKTLRGPRGGLILSNDKEIIKKVNSAVFPGAQGGPLMHVIAAKAVAFKEALSEDYKKYTKQVVANANAMAKEFMSEGLKVVSGGTDTHLFSVDVQNVGHNGKTVETVLDSVNITLNKNSLPFDVLPPSLTSGIRIGSPAITTRGFKEEEAKKVVRLIVEVVRNIQLGAGEISDALREKTKKQVIDLCDKFPIY